MSTRYENDQHRADEDRILEVVRKAWNIDSVQKLRDEHILDHALLRGRRIVAFVEVKCRSKQHEDLYIDARKVDAAMEHRRRRVRSFLVVEWPHGLYGRELRDDDILYHSWWGATGRDPQIVSHYAIDSFKPIRPPV